MGVIPFGKRRQKDRSGKGCKVACVGVLLAGLFFWGGAVSATDLVSGKRLYVEHCAGCHGESGISVLPGVPNLLRADIFTQPDSDLSEVISTGREMMPPFFGILDDREISDVTSYLRTLR